MKKNILISLSVFIILILVFASFQYYLKKNKATEDKIIVGATIGVLTSILNEIAGDKIEIVNLSEGFLHAHEIELSPAHLEKISKAKVIFTIGYGIDDWVKKISQEIDGEIVEVSSGVELIKFKKRINPHYWLSLKNAKIIASNITKKLIAIDPQNQNFYIKNLNNFYSKIDELNKIGEAIKKLENKKIIVTHPSFDYLAQELGLEITGYLKTEEGEGIGAKEFLDLATAVKKHNIKFIFVEKGFEDFTIKQFANLYNLDLIILDPLEIASQDQLYSITMQENLNKIYNNLK